MACGEITFRRHIRRGGPLSVIPAAAAVSKAMSRLSGMDESESDVASLLGRTSLNASSWLKTEERGGMPDIRAQHNGVFTVCNQCSVCSWTGKHLPDRSAS